jgi:hypothetical protein
MGRGGQSNLSVEPIAQIAIRLLLLIMGGWLVIWTIFQAIRTFVMPRSQNTSLTRFIFRGIARMQRIWMRRMVNYDQRDSILAYFAPIALLVTPLVWLFLTWVGFGFINLAISEQLDLREAFVMSGSSLMTLGFKFDDENPIIVLAFLEAAMGMMLTAVLIGYLPTMYSAFSAREKFVSKLETRAGSPPSPVEMILRLNRVQVLMNEGQIQAFGSDWEDWFAQLEENHTSLAALNFFRSPKPHRSWVTASGVVMDSFALMMACIDAPHFRSLGVSVRAGYIALRGISDFFRLEYPLEPQPFDPISIDRYEFFVAYDRMLDAGIKLYADREQCWRDFSGWRVNYDSVLRQLAEITYAPYAMWVSDHILNPDGTDKRLVLQAVRKGTRRRS